MNTFRRPRFRRHYHVRIWPPDNVVLFWESGNVQLHGRLMVLLAPFLDGQHTYDQMVHELRDQLTALDVQFGLSQLAERGHIIEADEPEEAYLATFRDTLGVDPTTFRNAIDSIRITVRACDGSTPETFASILRSFSLRVEDAGDLTVALVDHPLQAELEPLHRQSLHTRRPWTMIKPVGSVLAFGPIFQPGKTPCWNCLTLRLRESPETQALLPVLKQSSYSRLDLPPMRHAALNLAAIEILKWAVGASGEIGDTMFTLDTATMQLERHVVVHRGDCPSCGTAAEKSDTTMAPMELHSREKVFTADGGHRAQDPSAVFERYKHHISALTGVVHTLAPMEGVDPEIAHVYLAGHNFVLEPRRTNPVDSLRTFSRGKGMTASQARTSALCEALERYAGIFRGNEMRRKTRADQLLGEAIFPNTCLNFSEHQFQNRCPTDGNPRNWVPELFDQDREVDWSPVWSLTEHRFKYLPTACCYYGYPVDLEHDFAHADSNGCAAGVTLEDAILQGFLEVVERDSLSIWWHNRLRRPAIDLNSLEDHGLRKLAQYYARLGRSLWVLDVTADLGIPSVVAISMKVDGTARHLLMGAGAHLDPFLAVSRAITEVNQGLPHALRSDIRVTDELLCAQPFLHPDKTMPCRSRDQFPEHSAFDLRDDIDTCVRLAGQNGLEVLVLDQSRSDLGLPVVRVIVPGMRHFWRRLGPGRLYDVPLKLGWLPEPLREDALNPEVIGM